MFVINNASCGSGSLINGKNVFHANNLFFSTGGDDSYSLAFKNNPIYQSIYCMREKFIKQNFYLINIQYFIMPNQELKNGWLLNNLLNLRQ